MILNMYSVYDAKSGAFLTPFFMMYDGQAIRAISEAARDPNTQLGRYPEDFHLHRLGLWDDQNARFVPENPMSLGVVASFLQARPTAPVSFVPSEAEG